MQNNNFIWNFISRTNIFLDNQAVPNLKASLAPKDRMLLSAFQIKVFFFLDLLNSSSIFKRMACASALFNNFRA